MSTFPPRTAAPGQQISFVAGNSLRTLQATEVDGRWVIQPETNADEAAVRRHRLPVDAELAARQEDDSRLAGDALRERASELDIPGRSRMNADQLREAIAEREASGEQSPIDEDADMAQEENR